MGIVDRDDVDGLGRRGLGESVVALGVELDVAVMVSDAVAEPTLLDSQLVDVFLLNGVDFLQDVPNDRFVTWRIRRRSRVHPSVFEVDQGKDVLELLRRNGFLGKVGELQRDEEVLHGIVLGLIGPLVLGFLGEHDGEMLLLKVRLDEVSVFVDLAIFEVTFVDNLKFNIKPLAVDGVLRRRMKVELKTSELLSFTIYRFSYLRLKQVKIRRHLSSKKVSVPLRFEFGTLIGVLAEDAINLDVKSCVGILLGDQIDW